MNELRSILKRVGLTALYVTHDQGEAFAVADQVLIMRADPQGGWIEQKGAPAQVYRYPATPYVARFLGFKNLLPGTLLPGTEGTVETALGPLRAGDGLGTAEPGALASGASVTVLVRPEAANLRAATESGPNVVGGRLIDASFRGGYYLIRSLHVNGVELVTEVSATDDALPSPGEEMALWLDPDAITLLPA